MNIRFGRVGTRASAATGKNKSLGPKARLS
jgi:hypothetical protein